MTGPGPTVAAVAADPDHRFSKPVRSCIELIAGLGIVGDAHAGATVRHRSRVAVDASQPNLRQVHLIAGEWLGELAAAGFAVAPGDLGENVLTQGLDLLSLPCGSVLRLAGDAAIEVTGLRNPCAQIERFRAGLLAHAVTRRGDAIVRKAGIMAIVRRSGVVRPGDRISVELPPLPHRPLDRV